MWALSLSYISNLKEDTVSTFLHIKNIKTKTALAIAYGFKKMLNMYGIDFKNVVADVSVMFLENFSININWKSKKEIIDSEIFFDILPTSLEGLSVILLLLTSYAVI